MTRAWAAWAHCCGRTGWRVCSCSHGGRTEARESHAHAGPASTVGSGPRARTAQDKERRLTPAAWPGPTWSRGRRPLCRWSEAWPQPSFAPPCWPR